MSRKKREKLEASASPPPIESHSPDELREKIAKLPTEPGVYIMKDKKGQIVYIGKAASLRHRVRSYFSSSSDDRAFIALLEHLLGDIETIITHNEKEALLLENNLIKQHRPRFNVKLVDDKNYLVLKLDPKARYPRLEVVRRIGDDGAHYFGPYHSATSCRATLRVINRHFKLRTCTDHVLNSRTRACLQYDIKRCDAPCVLPIPAEEYQKQVDDVALFLKGRDSELMRRLNERMKTASAEMEFEIAATLRDQIHALQKTLEDQRVVSADLADQDIFGFFRHGDVVEIVILFVRHGKMLGRRTFSFSDQEFASSEILSSFVSLYYDLGSFIPDEILLPFTIDDAELKQEWLSEKRNAAARVSILAPQRGAKRKLIELAQKNAASAFVMRKNRAGDIETSLQKLQNRLGLKNLPRRIECFDISHIQGTNTVASRVVFLDGEPLKSDYRMFHVRSVQNDDFAAMYEVISRRLRRAKAEPDGAWRLPDLMVIDGGKGQLSSALAAIKDSDLPSGTMMDIISIAKERVEEETAPPTDANVAESANEKPREPDKTTDPSKKPDRVFIPNGKEPIRLRPNSTELFVLARIRDEAHRFAITFHRKQRSKKTLRSSLNDIPGIGEARRKALLRFFGSAQKVGEASHEALLNAPGMNRSSALAVYQFFHGTPDTDNPLPKTTEHDTNKGTE